MRARMSLALFTLLAGAAQAAVIYVDDSATGADDGSSWADAYTDLESALSAAALGDEVWVAEGTYTPSRQADTSDPTMTTSDPRDATFWIPRGVKVYGGFDGTEGSLATRAGLFSTTILSGDIGTPNVFSDNAHRVVFYTSVHNGSASQGTGAVLDGFVVEEANADSTTAGGAGVYVIPGSISGALFSPVFSVANCVIRDNVSIASGAGMAATGGLNGTIRDTEFLNNATGGNGGGLFVSSPSNFTLLARCRFVGNVALGNGGGFARGSVSVPSPHDLDLVACVFEGNAADGRGGGVWWGTNGDADSVLRVTDCLVINNTAGSFGGGLAVQPGADLNPGTIAGSVANVSSSTFADNAAVDAGGGVHAGVSASSGPDAAVSVSNTILWHNTAASDPQINMIATVNVVYSNVEGGGTTFGNINADPKFVDRPNLDYRILNGSPCADAGINSLLEPDAADLDGDANTAEELPLDLFGNARRLDSAMTDTGSGAAPITDMGAHELCSADFDLDGDVDSDDTDAFLDAYSNGDPAADMDGDGDLDFFDVSLFATAHNNGC